MTVDEDIADFSVDEGVNVRVPSRGKTAWENETKQTMARAVRMFYVVLRSTSKY
jgi:hypothetical protein